MRTNLKSYTMELKKNNVRFKMEAVPTFSSDGLRKLSAELDTKTDVADIKLQGALDVNGLKNIPGDQAKVNIKPKVKLNPALLGKLKDKVKEFEESLWKALGKAEQPNNTSFPTPKSEGIGKHVQTESKARSDLNIKVKPYMRFNLKPDKMKVGLREKVHTDTIDISAVTALNGKGTPQAELEAKATINENTSLRLKARYNKKFAGRIGVWRKFHFKEFKVDSSAYIQSEKGNKVDLIGFNLTAKNRDNTKFFFMDAKVSSRNEVNFRAGIGIRF